MVNKVAKLLYHCTYLSPMISVSMLPQPLPTSLSSLALLCYMSTSLVLYSIDGHQLINEVRVKGFKKSKGGVYNY